MGGVTEAHVTGTVVQHVSEVSALLFQWNPFDHFAITDLDAARRTGTVVNWTHGNALDIGPSGTLVVSFRSRVERYAINPVARTATRLSASDPSGPTVARLGGSTLGHRSPTSRSPRR